MKPVVQISGVSHAYGRKQALNDIGLDIPAGCMVALIGPDGVGKSTLLDLVAGARTCQGGVIYALGGDMRNHAHRRLTGPDIAYMPQGLGRSLYHTLSVAENLAFFSRLFRQTQSERQARIERLTRATGLFPFLDRPVGKLSGGMKQKLGLCCALMNDPLLLILDEPTTGIDPLSRRQFWELVAAMRREAPGMSVIVSTAYMDEAANFDWLVAMEGGHVLATGSPAELLRQTGAASLEQAFLQLVPGNGDVAAAPVTAPPLENGTGKPALIARGLTRRFGDFTAVDDVSFEIQPGEIFGFLGSNGCGKTTTMKMLTGLLPMSEGEAFLFGQPVDAHDLKMRHRVGFMSQSYSLYGQLTAAQNLSLHARLFELPPDAARSRIAQLSARFGLGDFMDSRSESLPLGIKQRLSLAIAVLHEPDVLILDEPTSGVDPAARDQFWELLIQLSREDGVTIFISTHFMNEAMRCDRISLMHDGKVLVCDTPQALAGSGTLEDAFVHHIQKATPPQAAPDLTAQAPKPASSEPARAEPVLSPRRMFAISRREILELGRDPIRLAFAFFGSLLLLVVIAYGVSVDVERITFAALDRDRTPESRAFVAAYSGSPYFVEIPAEPTSDGLYGQLVSGAATVVFEIPAGFGRQVAGGDRPEISAWIDGSNTMRAGTIEGFVSGAQVAYLLDIARQNGFDPEALSPVLLQNHYRYNPGFESIRAMGPGVPAMLLMLIPAILMAVSIAREKEIGTIVNFYVTPTARLEFLLGKQLPYVAVTMFNFLALTLVVVFVLGVPLRGSIAGLFAGSLLFALASTAYGLLLSTLTRTQVSAVFAAAMLTMMPTVQFSGLLLPVSTLSDTAQAIGRMWPASYYVHLSVGAYTKGLGWSELWPDLAGLAVFFPAFLLMAALFLRKQAR